MELIEAAGTRLRISDVPVTVSNLTMYPLLGEYGRDPGYLTLDEALERKTARITEASEGGSVPELLLANDGPEPVFLLDGEEVVGLKQNRTLNVSLLAALGTLRIPVTCVEAGRWSGRAGAGSSSPHAHYASARARNGDEVTESLMCYGTRHTLQARVWEDIDRKADRLQVPSATRSMAAMYQRHAAPIEEYVHGLPATEGQTGAIFAVNGEIAGMDLFDSPATLSKLLPKVVRSYALDALDAPENGASAPTRAAAVEFLQAVEQAEEQRFPAIGMGEEIRLSGDGLAGAALVVEGRVIHLAAFRVTRGFGGSGFGVQGE